MFGYLQFLDLTKDNIAENYPARDPLMFVGRLGLAIMLLQSIVLLGFASRRNFAQLFLGDGGDKTLSRFKENVVAILTIGRGKKKICFFKVWGEGW